MGAHRERMIDVSWAPDRVGSFTIWVQVEALDRTRLLRDVTSAISDQGGNIVASSSATGRDRVAVLRYEIELSDPGQVPRLLEELRRVEGAYDAYRLVPRAGGRTESRRKTEGGRGQEVGARSAPSHDGKGWCVAPTLIESVGFGP